MELSSQYEKKALIGGGAARVWHGVENQTGRAVLLHCFHQDPAILHLAVQYVLQFPEQKELLQCGEWEGSSCLVTPDNLELLDIKTWMEHSMRTRSAAAQAAGPENTNVDPDATVLIPAFEASLLQSPPPPPRNQAIHAPEPRQAPGEFTRAFQIPTVGADQQAPSAPPVPPSHGAPPAASTDRTPKPAPISEPGEFTRIFGPVSVQPPSPASAPPESEPGLFTQTFQVPAQPPKTSALSTGAPAPVEPGTAGRAEPGTFTNTFGVPAFPSSASGPAPVAGGSTLQHPAGNQPGEFTRMFHAPAPEGNRSAEPVPYEPRYSAPIPTQGTSGSVGEFTQMFGVAASPNAPSASPQPQVPMPTAEPRAPSDYTRVIQKSALSPAAPPPPAAQSAAMPTPLSMGSFTPPSVTTPSVGVTTPSVTPPSVTAPSVTPPTLTAPSLPSMQAPPVAPAPAPEVKRGAVSPALILLLLVMLIALAIVLFFALRR